MKNIKIFLSIVFALFVLFALPNISYCAEDYCEITIDGETYKYNPSGVQFYIDAKVQYGETIKIHIHQKATGIHLDDENKCWTYEEQSANIKSARYSEVIVNDIEWASNEVDFDVQVQFKEQESKTAKLWIKYGTSEWNNWVAVINFSNISDELYKQKKQEEQKKEAEKYEGMNENVETYYKTDIEQFRNGSGGIAASNQMLYLRSILYNDKKNGNNNLWNQFVKDTTPDERTKWKKNMSYYLRNSDKEYQTVHNALNEQILLDIGETTKDKVQDLLDKARERSIRCIYRK